MTLYHWEWSISMSKNKSCQRFRENILSMHYWWKCKLTQHLSKMVWIFKKIKLEVLEYSKWVETLHYIWLIVYLVCFPEFCQKRSLSINKWINRSKTTLSFSNPFLCPKDIKNTKSIIWNGKWMPMVSMEICIIAIL